MFALLRNPWVILGAVVVLGGVFAAGIKTGNDYARGRAARDAVLVQQAVDKIAQETAVAISRIKVVNQTNRTRIEREIVKVPDLTTCRAGDDVKRVLDDALAGKAGTDPATDSVVP